MGQTPSNPTNEVIDDNTTPQSSVPQTAPTTNNDQDQDLPPADDFEEKHKGTFVQVLYGSSVTTKHGMKLAYKLAQRYAVKHSPLPVTVTSIDQFEPENLSKLKYCILVLSTHENGTAAPAAKEFQHWLNDAAQDFRYGKGWLTKLRFAVVGLGSSDYKRNYNAIAKEFKINLKALGAKMFASPCLLDYSDSVDSTPEDTFEKWCLHTLLPAVQKDVDAETEKAKEKAAIAKHVEDQRKLIDKLDVTTAPSADDEAGGENIMDSDDEDDEYYEEDEEEDIVDVEDMGAEMGGESGEAKTKKPRQMLSERQHRALTKQGYRIVGSHSGVKLCRWLKASTRGRGQCYKHTFYGIISHRCMEMTPSLACASKCTFCWRHYTNPVGREWKWEMDQPEVIIQGALDNHKNMVKQLRGSPGVIPERLIEASTPQHCALSLVGEPIMYPEINKYVGLLHEKGISSFLVTNATFPEQLKTLTPVTQLYLSIDAHNKETLKEIDRPLHEDFYERFLESQQVLRDRKERTVYRLTLVKGFNMEDAILGYSKLVQIGQPTFIEIKGVTFSGPDGGIRMSNVPYHEEVKQFCEALCTQLNSDYAAQNLVTQYELACEHAHSCCILIADTRMKKQGNWHTWIDYPKFQALYSKFKETGEEFTDEDYSCETPAWAQYGATEAGFDPKETKYTARGKNRDNLKNKQTPAAEGQGCCQTGDADAQQGGCCQTGDADAQQGGCCQTDEPKAQGGCCQTGEPKAQGGCCSTEAASTEKTGCCSSAPAADQSSSCCKGDEVAAAGQCCKQQPEQQESVPAADAAKGEEKCDNCDCGKQSQ